MNSGSKRISIGGSLDFVQEGCEAFWSFLEVSMFVCAVLFGLGCEGSEL